MVPRDMVNRVGAAAELDYGRHESAIAGVRLTDPEKAVAAASPALDPFDPALPGDRPRALLRLVAELSVGQLGGRAVVGALRQEERRHQRRLALRGLGSRGG